MAWFLYTLPVFFIYLTNDRESKTGNFAVAGIVNGGCSRREVETGLLKYPILKADTCRV
jgi:hypothetical protein